MATWRTKRASSRAAFSQVEVSGNRAAPWRPEPVRRLTMTSGPTAVQGGSDGLLGMPLSAQVKLAPVLVSSATRPSSAVAAGCPLVFGLNCCDRSTLRGGQPSRRDGTPWWFHRHSVLWMAQGATTRSPDGLVWSLDGARPP